MILRSRVLRDVPCYYHHQGQQNDFQRPSPTNDSACVKIFRACKLVSQMFPGPSFARTWRRSTLSTAHMVPVKCRLPEVTNTQNGLEFGLSDKNIAWKSDFQPNRGD